ncbi:uncharacterized protein LOC135376231 [Ornithodoros turicata]|uniref:uncharacterized protein LOC135376231 n=1 Tax=Ornithodoros turicata TaxID=34597 RepID=UPI00313A4933
MAGKRGRATLMATSVAPQFTESRLSYVQDRQSRIRFLVDTGADVSVSPASPADRFRKPLFHLLAVNHTGIPVYQQKSLSLNLGLRRSFRWVFLVAAVKDAILGADFLHHFRLTVDVSRRLLRDSTTSLAVAAIPASPGLPLFGSALAHLKSPFTGLLDQFPSLTRSPEWTRPVQHDLVHYIQTTGLPVSATTRPLPPQKLCIAKQEFEHMLSIGIARPSSSSWSSALHMVPKKTGD